MAVDDATKKAWSYIVQQNDIETASVHFSGKFPSDEQEAIDGHIYCDSNNGLLYRYKGDEEDERMEFKAREHEHEFNSSFFYREESLDEESHFYDAAHGCGCKHYVKIEEHKTFGNDNDWAIEVKATCISDGSKSQACYGCGRKIYETIEKTREHDWQFKEYETEPTCTQPDIKIMECSMCKGVKSEAVTANGHTLIDGKCENCQYAEENKNDTLSGTFQVSPSLKVKFSKGNLYRSGSGWGFENSQYD